MCSLPSRNYVWESADICKAIMSAEEGAWVRLMTRSIPLITAATRKENGSEMFVRIDRSISVSDCLTKTLESFRSTTYKAEPTCIASKKETIAYHNCRTHPDIIRWREQNQLFTNHNKSSPTIPYRNSTFSCNFNVLPVLRPRFPSFAGLYFAHDSFTQSPSQS